MKKGNRAFDTIGNAAAALGVSVDTIKAAKRAGCTAFRGGRIYEADLLKWFSEHGKDEPEQPKNLRDQKVAEEIRKLRIKNDRDEGKLVQKSAVTQIVLEWEGEQAPIIERKLEREWPSSVAATPEDVPRVRMFGAQLNDEIRKCNRQLIEKLQKLGL